MKTVSIEAGLGEVLNAIDMDDVISFHGIDDLLENIGVELAGKYFRSNRMDRDDLIQVLTQNMSKTEICELLDISKDDLK